MGKSCVIWTAALVVVSWCATAQAADVPVTRAGLLERMDRDGDGKIQYEEYRNSMMRRFGNADRNDDGVLRADELPQHMVVIREAAKVDSDGSVTLDAFTDALKPVFDRFDANHDGVLEGEEIDAFARARAVLQEITP